MMKLINSPVLGCFIEQKMFVLWKSVTGSSYRYDHPKVISVSARGDNGENVKP